MYTTLLQYSTIITIQAKALLHSNIVNLNSTQRSAFRTINLHAEKLAWTVAALERTYEDKLPQFIATQLEHLVAPIQRYAELLTTSWVGQLNHDQSMHVDIILHSAIDLANLLNRHNSDNQARA
jgi:hypothetical protein